MVITLLDDLIKFFLLHLQGVIDTVFIEHSSLEIILISASNSRASTWLGVMNLVKLVNCLAFDISLINISVL